MLREHLGKDFCLVTPGIRPANASLDDQSRVVTPSDALNNGASYLVIGRPITKAENPIKALQLITQEINSKHSIKILNKSPNLAYYIVNVAGQLKRYPAFRHFNFWEHR